MSRARRLLAVALAGLLVAACGVSTEDEARSIPSDKIPTGLQPVDPSATTVVTPRESLILWFVSDQRLVSVSHRVPSPVTASTAVAELSAGPTETEQGRGLRSAIPGSDVVIGVTVAGGVATVELSPDFSQVPAADQVYAVGQLVLTLTDLRGVGRVGFVVAEADIAVPLPSGEAAQGTVSRDDFLALTESD